MEGYSEPKGSSEDLTLEEIELIAEAARRLGIEAFKITGGEPTLRDDLPEIVAKLRSIKAYVSMTTNASLLHKHIGKLAELGLGHINVSLHAMNPSRFKFVTNSTLYERVISNIKLAREYGIPVKINFVVLRDHSKEDIEKLVEFAAEIGARVQFIELHPVGKAIKVFKQHHLPSWRILELLSGRIVEIKYRIGLHNRPVITLDNGVIVEIVGPVGNHLFCAGCTRIRVTYDFKLIPCLNWKGPLIDVRSRLRKTRDKEEKINVIVESIREANSLRRPSVLWPIAGPPVRLPRKDTTMRLGLPKRHGILDFGSSKTNKYINSVLKSWGGYNEVK